MSETRFTPGPWHIVEGDSVVNIVAGTDAITATCTKAYYERFDTTDLANAHLIAAAPDLYTALQELSDVLILAFPAVAPSPTVTAALHALAKVRGESQPLPRHIGGNRDGDVNER